MKNFMACYLKSFCIAVFIALLVACKNTITMEPGEPVSWQLIVALLAGIYEVVARLIPTVKNYSLIAKIIEILLWISERFNRKK